MSKENPLWGAPRIHGELLKVGFAIAESTVSKYMIRRRGPPSQTWRTFLRNHADAIAAIDLCVVPTLTFECLFAFLVVGHGRRQLLWFAVTRYPTAEWLAQQIVEAFPCDTAPTYLVRNNDGAYGQAFTRRVRTMGIRDRPINAAIDPKAPRPLDPVVNSTAASIALVVVGGQPLYGDPSLLAQLLPPGTKLDQMTVCGAKKAIYLGQSAAAARNESFTDITNLLNAALANAGSTLPDIECD
jgi:hypothetical protein